jgi:hypothetical protein
MRASLVSSLALLVATFGTGGGSAPMSMKKPTQPAKPKTPKQP